MKISQFGLSKSFKNIVGVLFAKKTLTRNLFFL